MTLPGRWKDVPGPHVDGKPTRVRKYVLYTPGATHVKHVAGMMYQLNKLQIGEWLNAYLASDETSCCYLADGAESQQIDYLGQLLARRVAGQIEIMAVDLASLSGKTAEAQAAAFRGLHMRGAVPAHDHVVDLVPRERMAVEVKATNGRRTRLLVVHDLHAGAQREEKSQCHRTSRKQHGNA